MALVLVLGLAAGGSAQPGATRATPLKLELPPLAVNFAPALFLPPISIAVHAPRPVLLKTAIYHLGFHGCGFSGGFRAEIEARESSIPDLAAIWAVAFRGCRTIKAARLEPLVPVASYPEGHFGDWIHEGLLVTDRIEIVDETRLRQLFALLVGATGVAEDSFEYFWTAEDPALPLSGYRRETGFVPDLVFEFVGSERLQVEISVAQKRVLVQAGDKWDTYALERGSAAALQEFLKAGGIKRAVAN